MKGAITFENKVVILTDMIQERIEMLDKAVMDLKQTLEEVK